MVPAVEDWMTTAEAKGQYTVITFTYTQICTLTWTTIVACLLMNVFCLFWFFCSIDKEVAMKFFRTLSSHGKRPDPASKAALHRTRVRSAVMTPTRKQRLDDKLAQSNYQQLSRSVRY